MVVSGLPKPNGEQHVVEICSMALEYIFQTENYLRQSSRPFA